MSPLEHGHEAVLAAAARAIRDDQERDGLLQVFWAQLRQPVRPPVRQDILPVRRPLPQRGIVV
ncbi:hypothetical protein EON09_01185 [Pseudomonas soli]|jgi:hypothetical protein|uniref:Uncharacterized protein n=1 Tax=Pseudomonas soli TaxID=1306993 RepID=A0A1H9KVN9_9PSED|nr:MULTISPECIES: hypothetical protein [Pseudomonas]AIN59254.1 hypothetical protein O165_013575 [Pseudomonas soli]AUY36697.1 hypothetical protein C3F42_27355 [Pseudomonas sp. PONIH3]MCX5507032.1 hypothetical protein [Pseudomonas sp. BJa3]MDT3714979.1 hypothetical protein [Pseudomonas soli]MDT3731392.1 hypothetical protein [Pseudomonas soli]